MKGIRALGFDVIGLYFTHHSCIFSVTTNPVFLEGNKKINTIPTMQPAGAGQEERLLPVTTRST